MRPLAGPPAPRAFFDVETDPYAGNYDLIWCIGVLDEATGVFQQFVAERPKDERRMLVEFLAWYGATNPAHFLAYSGCDFDRQRLIIRLQAHNLPVPSSIQHSVDVFWVVRRALAVPISSYRLKPVAEMLGFSFRHPGLNGYDVACHYMAAVRSRRRIPTRLLEYNEDDVRSLAHVLAAAERICGYGGPPKKSIIRPMVYRPLGRHVRAAFGLGAQPA